MAITIDGTGSITGVSANGGLSAAQTGSVIQVVNATYGTLTGNSTSTYADTGLTATITPKFSTSKILVFCSINGCSKQGASVNNSIDLQLVRGSTSILQFEGALGINSSASAATGVASSASYLDSPATTSATTYKVQFAADQNAGTVYVQLSNGRLANSTITLMEIAG
jgi:hypothetical protein